MGKHPDEQLSVQVRVFRQQAGQVQRVYRQIWSGQVMAQFNLQAARATGHITGPGAVLPDLFLLRAREERSYIAVRLDDRTGDFSIDQFTHEWPLTRYLLRAGVPVRALEALKLPVPLDVMAPVHQTSVQQTPVHQAKAQEKKRRLLVQQQIRRKLSGPSRLVAPFFTGDARCIAMPKGDDFRLELQVLRVRKDGLQNIFNHELRTSSFLALPVTGMKFANFDVQYLLNDGAAADGGARQIIHSACHDGYTSFGLTSCASDRHASLLLARRGVSAQMGHSVGLPVSPVRVAVEQAVRETLTRIAGVPTLR